MQIDSDGDRYGDSQDYDNESGSYVLDPLPSQRLQYLNDRRQGYVMDTHGRTNNKLANKNKAPKRGKLVTFFRNGDPHYKGLPVSVSSKDFASFETLMVFLNEKISTTTGVRHIFSMQDGKEITDINEFLTGQYYLASSVKKPCTNIIYGNSREGHWINKNFSAGKFRKGESKLLINHEDRKLPRSYPGSPQVPNSRVLEIISNTNRDSIERVILNTQTTQSFEEILGDITDMIVLQHPPVTALYTARPPFKRVESFSQLTRDFYDHFEFLACGREGRPLELVSKREVPPDTNSSTESRYSHHTSKTYTPRSLQQPSPHRTKAPSNEHHAGFRHLAPGQNNRDHRARVPRKIQRYEPEDEDSPSPDNLPSERYVVQKGRQALNTRHRPRTPANDDNVEEIRVDIHGNPRVFYPPRDPTDYDGKSPDKALKLNWVYGYRGRDARNNIFVLPSGDVLYYVAAVAIMLDRKRDRQRHYLGHTEDITSMALHPNRLQPYVATGQLAGNTDAHIRIWDSRSLATYAVIGAGVFQNSVSSLSFSVENDGEYLLAVDEGAKHMLYVWDWQNERPVAKTTWHSTDVLPKTSVDTVVWGCFHPHDSTIIITYGKEHVYFWKLFWDASKTYSGRLLRDKHSGNFSDEVPKFVTAMAFSQDGDVITGDSNGRIIVWSRNHNNAFVINRQYSDNMRHAHSKTVFTLCVLEDGTMLSGGGNEIRAWDTYNRYAPVKQRMVRLSNYV